MTETNWDRIAELFKKEFSEYDDTPTPVFEIIKEFDAFRLGYHCGGVDALAEFSARMKGKNVVYGA